MKPFSLNLKPMLRPMTQIICSQAAADEKIWVDIPACPGSGTLKICIDQSKR